MTKLIQQLTTLKKKTLANGGDFLDLEAAERLFNQLEPVIARLEMMTLAERELSKNQRRTVKPGIQ
jgi:hypothetical protein